MKRPLASLVLLLLIICGAPSVRAKSPDEYDKDEVLKEAKIQFKLLKVDVQSNSKYAKYKNNKEFLSYVEGTQRQFEALFDKRIPADNLYKKQEVEYLKGLFDKVILPQLKDTMQALNEPGLTPDEGKAKVQELALALPQRAAVFKTEFTQGLVGVRTATMTGKQIQESRVGGQLPDGAGQIMTQSMANDFVDNSPVIILANEAANYAVKHVADPPVETKPETKPEPTTPANPTNPPDQTNPQGGGQVGGGQMGRPNSRPRGGVTPSDIVNSIAAGGGNQLANRSGYEYSSGNYGAAVSMAERALRFDPKNKSAMAVLYSAKGRGDAMDASASELKAANAGAAAFGPSGFAGEGAASPSSEIAAAAMSGAARVAGDQARSGAMNALKLGDAGGALAILTKALKLDPNNPALLNLRAQTYGRLGRWEEALKDAAAGLALLPGNMALLNTLALSQNRTRRYREALATSEQMIAADPRNAWAYANRAHAWGGLGNRDAMMSDINRAAALDPSFQRAAADAATLQLPSDSDVMFLFPGEAAKGALKAPLAAGRGKSFSAVVGAGIAGGLLLALGLLSLVLAPLKDSVVSVFTGAKRTGASTAPVATAQPASVGGNVGGLIRGQYEISRQIGAGGMGMVYEGTDRTLGRRVAIKKMRDELRLNARDRDRFIIEAKTVASLHHPNIVDIYAIAEEGEDVYLVFEYVDGKTVHDLVQTAGRLAPAESLRLTRAMGEALTYAHSRGVIHRDMKPSNVMLTSAGQVKVMDFGIARMAKDTLTRYSMTNTVVGTPPYMAPEQEQGVVRKESDVYALAICAYEMLTGKLPFIGLGAGMLINKVNMSYVPPSRNIAGLPVALDEVFLKAFQADPDRRYRTPLEFVTALAAAVDGARSKTA